jgi:hypothetical protein
MRQGLASQLVSTEASLISWYTIVPTISRCASSSVPISLRSALVSDVGMENLWLIYLSEAASSPSGPRDLTFL